MFGLALIAAMYALLWAEHYCSFGSWAVSSDRALDVVVTFATCFLVGVFEEGLFRGYAQFKLARAIGFWSAAFAISLAFGLVHLIHPTYTMRGVASAALFGVLFAYCLWRTGDLWLAIGIHTAVNFAELFIFAPASSSAHLPPADVHGPAWLTGGRGGPEASVNGYAVIALAFVVVWAATRGTMTGARSFDSRGQNRPALTQDDGAESPLA
jgi:CAAX protease family protein